MQPEERDPSYIWDMLEYARLALDLTRGISFHAYSHDRIKQLALERALEIVGEAARRVSERFRQNHPEIPWGVIVAHRNVLAHEYGEIRQERLWQTATEQVPGLVERLIPLIPPSPESL